MILLCIFLLFVFNYLVFSLFSILLVSSSELSMGFGDHLTNMCGGDGVGSIRVLQVGS